MKRKELMELQKMAAIEEFVGENLYDYIEKKIGLDWRKVIEEKEITPFIQNLMDESLYFEYQLRDRETIDVLSQLVFSRCIEFRLLDKWKGKAILTGTDKDQLITKFSSHYPDIREISGNYFYEVVTTYNGQFMLNSKIYIGKEKMDYLVNFAKSHNLFLVGVDVLAKGYFFVPIKNSYEKMPYVGKGVLTGYSIDIKDIDWFSLDEPDLVVD